MHVPILDSEAATVSAVMERVGSQNVPPLPQSNHLHTLSQKALLLPCP